MTLTVGSLFAGIGGFDLGLERAGMRVAWQCEINPFARHILAKHWPDVPCYEDITQLQGSEVERVDVLCGGFPCQDISSAGRGAGIGGARSSLWTEIARLVGEIQPRYVIVENVAALRSRGLDKVLGDLAARGYDAEWDGLRASDFGAPHRRDRIWIVAYHRSEGCQTIDGGASRRRTAADTERQPLRLEPRRRGGPHWEGTPQPRQHGYAQSLADTDSLGQHGGPRVFGAAAGWSESQNVRAGLAEPWAAEPDVGRVAHGVPARVDRLAGLGNALVPQIAEWIGRRILLYEGL